MRGKALGFCPPFLKNGPGSGAPPLPGRELRGSGCRVGNAAPHRVRLQGGRGPGRLALASTMGLPVVVKKERFRRSPVSFGQGYRLVAVACGGHCPRSARQQSGCYKAGGRRCKALKERRFTTWGGRRNSLS